VAAFQDALAEQFEASAGHHRERIQARAGTPDGPLSKLGALVLATGSKSEISVGYSTLYGDMVGGFALGTCRTWVYRLARWHQRV
jgi:NH3-dependent NAD+ synthetase